MELDSMQEVHGKLLYSLIDQSTIIFILPKPQLIHCKIGMCTSGCVLHHLVTRTLWLLQHIQSLTGS